MLFGSSFLDYWLLFIFSIFLNRKYGLLTIRLLTTGWTTHSGFLSQWRLSLLFVISGIGTFFNISKKTGLEFAKDRFQRLVIPLVVGILFIIPTVVYFQRLNAGLFTGNYLEFWLLKANIGVDPQGNFSWLYLWLHLWYLVYLLIFSLLLIPVFLYTISM